MKSMRSTKKQAVMDPSKISRSRQEEMLKRYDTDLNEQEGTPDKQEGAARGAALSGECALHASAEAAWQDGAERPCSSACRQAMRLGRRQARCWRSLSSQSGASQSAESAQQQRLERTQQPQRKELWKKQPIPR